MLTPSSRRVHAATRAVRLLAAALAGGFLLTSCTGTTPIATELAPKDGGPTLAQVMGDEPVASTDPWSANCYSGFEDDILAIAGQDSFDCGFMRMDASDAQRHDADQCAQVAQASHRAYRVGHIDADGKTLACDVAIRDAGGQLWRVYYDFDLQDERSHGLSDGVLVASRCNAIDFRPGTALHGSFFALDGCTAVPAGVAAVPFSPGHALR